MDCANCIPQAHILELYMHIYIIILYIYICIYLMSQYYLRSFY